MAPHESRWRYREAVQLRKMPVMPAADRPATTPTNPAAGSTTGAVTVAFDAGPLYGHRTGIGNAVAELDEALSARPDVRLRPYLVSGRARPTEGTTRLPLPGIVAAQVWSRTDRLRADRWFGPVDVVHGTNYVAPPSRRPTIISVYDCWFVEHPELANPTVLRAARWMTRRVDDGAWLLCCSDATAQAALRSFDTDRIVTVPLGPPPPIADHPIRPELGLDRVDIVAVGTEEKRKGYPDLVKAFGVLSQQWDPGNGDAPTLVIAGAPGDDSDEVGRAIDELDGPVRSRVARLGVIGGQQKAWLLRNASVLAYPSLDEGFGFPILEANLAGIPVAARSVGSIPEVAGDAAGLVADGVDFVGAFAELLGELLTDGDERDRLVASGRANVDRFSWDRCAAGTADLYHRLAEGAH